jgi:hypothetical protein
LRLSAQEDGGMGENADSVRAMYGAFGRGDVEGVIARLHPDVEWDHSWRVDPPEAYRPRRGHDAVRGFFAGLADVEFLKFRPVAFLTGGEMVAAPIEVAMRARATGRVLEDLEMHLWVFGDDGLVRRHRAFVDSLALRMLHEGG